MSHPNVDVNKKYPSSFSEAFLNACDPRKCGWFQEWFLLNDSVGVKLGRFQDIETTNIHQLEKNPKDCVSIFSLTVLEDWVDYGLGKWILVSPRVT